MFEVEEQIPDTVKDGISMLIEKLNDRKNWNDEAKEKLASLLKLLKKQGYIFFSGSPYRYHLHQIGNSCLYDIPINRRGHLSVSEAKGYVLCASHLGVIVGLQLQGLFNTQIRHNLRIPLPVFLHHAC